jgi:hypothetical protein
MQVKCDQCEKYFYRSSGAVERHKKHFCCQDCYTKYAHLHPGEFSKKLGTHDFSHQQKLKLLRSQLNERKMKGEL